MQTSPAPSAADVPSLLDKPIWEEKLEDATALHMLDRVKAALAAVPVDADGTTGCEPGDFATGAFTGKIALIKRGGCAFAVKQQNAGAAGAVGAIIYNNTDGVLSGTPTQAGSYTFTVTARNMIGAASSTHTIVVDFTAPAAAPSATSGWSNRDVTVNWNWTDGGAGIDSARCTTSSTSSGQGAALALSAQ